jgi:hypothetical protein
MLMSVVVSTQNVSASGNRLVLEWKPQSSGQLIVSSLTIRWKEVAFTYTARGMKRRPTIRIDIVPSEPTQRLEVTPKFLIPGHEQPLHFSFSAGSDHVKGGALQLHSTPGLLFLAMDTTTTTMTSAASTTNEQQPNKNSVATAAAAGITNSDDDDPQTRAEAAASGKDVGDGDDGSSSARKWVIFLNTPLPPCLPGQTVTITTRVKNARQYRYRSRSGHT